MMDWTDRHCRFFLRQISRHARLYTEMITAPALLHGDVPHHLDFHPYEHPVALRPPATVLDVADSIHHDLRARCTGARVWGPSARFEGQQVGRGHELFDEGGHGQPSAGSGARRGRVARCVRCRCSDFASSGGVR